MGEREVVSLWVWGELESLKVTEGTKPVGVLDRSPSGPIWPMLISDSQVDQRSQTLLRSEAGWDLSLKAVLRPSRGRASRLRPERLRSPWPPGRLSVCRRGEWWTCVDVGDVCSVGGGDPALGPTGGVHLVNVYVYSSQGLKR